MKKLAIGISFVLLIHIGSAQTIGIGTTTPHPSAQLEIKSTNKGVLLPRLDTAQINKIAQPDSGLIVYCTTYKQLAVWNGTNWMLGDGTSMNPIKLGDNFGGGFVFYVDGSGKHGLTALPSAVDWCYPNDFSAFYAEQGHQNGFPYYFHSGIGSGKSNTAAIISFGIYDPYYPSLKTLTSSFMEGFGDWYLPSRMELELLVKTNREGHFFDALTSGTLYWTSEIKAINGLASGITTYWVRCLGATCSNNDAWTSAKWNTSGINMILIRQF